MKRILAVLLAVLMLASMTAFSMAEEAAEAPATEEAAEAPAAEEAAPEAEEAEAPAEEETPFEVLQNGSRGELVVALQKKLKELGYKVGTADGIFGPRTEKGLKAFQADMGWEETGAIADQATLDSILAYVKAEEEVEQTEDVQSDGVNLIQDGEFKDVATYWKKWGNPLLCESVEENGKTWLHLISSGAKKEGLAQNIGKTSEGAKQAAIVAGQAYTLSFTAYGVEESAGKEFNFLITNRNAENNEFQEQFWTTKFTLTTEPTTYTFTFVPTVDGAISIGVGTGVDQAIEAWFSDVKVEKGGNPTE